VRLRARGFCDLDVSILIACSESGLKCASPGLHVSAGSARRDPLVAGVVAGALAGTGSRAGLIVLALAWLAAAAGLWRGRRAVVVAATVTGCLAAGVALGARANHAAADPSLLVWFHESSARNDPVRLEAVLREDATPRPGSGQALQPGAGAGGLAVTVDAVTADGRPVDGGVRVTIAGALAAGRAREWRAGRTVAMTVLLREPLDYRDPGVPGDRARLARQGIVLLGSVKSAALTAMAARGSWLAEGAAALRAWVRRSTAAAVGPWSPRSAGVVTAILIGDRSGLEPEDERRLQEAGTYHVIAISGGNIALLTALLVAAGAPPVCPAARRRPRRSRCSPSTAMRRVWRRRCSAPRSRAWSTSRRAPSTTAARRSTRSRWPARAPRSARRSPSSTPASCCPSAPRPRS
jgi:hypothetical protein